MPTKNKEDVNAYYRRLYAEGRTWAQRNKSALSRKRRRRTLKQYDLTPEQWEVMFESQGKACAICKGTDPRGPQWATDHCHTTNKVRGILCNGCNTGIGQMLDNPTTLRLAAEYIENHR